ncbi:MAG: response regulator [Phycisphaera sp.]|nr:response regulator [Phycisphaera sp.]
MRPRIFPKIVDILLVENHSGDVRLVEEALREGKLLDGLNVELAADGQEALDFLYRKGPFADAPRPRLILLDLNLPKKDGRDILDTIKKDVELRTIPVLVLTTSDSPTDLAKAYELGANGFVTKPDDLDQFFEAIKDLQHFWFDIATLPSENIA